ncbi:TetR/AcrR family transcriptional regulator [Demequina sp. NBRC 110056]|uniref:TetR/AcrR family transcriptional regulator n=1 Tax=Demequina sp. NBRC 110056 TaxID=1570345 RepID=UPI000A05DBFA|nr:TetR/AcrR family transcriptional regulator [Demequina sp. NBRC 110056]
MSVPATATTKDAILSATRGAVLEDGYAALSTRKVAERAGVPLSQIHYHFGSKENLVLRLFEAENASLVDRQAAMFASDEPLSAQWARACDYLDEDLDSGYVRILQELLAAGYSQPGIREPVSAMLEGWITVLTDAFAHHEARGLDLGMPPAHLASLAGAVFLGAESVVLADHESASNPIRDALRAVGGVIEAAERRAAATEEG